MKWTLPESVTVGGVKHSINTEYRRILTIIERLKNEHEHPQVRVFVALALFYHDFDSIKEEDYKEAAEKMMWFISCGEEDDGERHPKTIDWEQDYSMIVSDICKTASRDIRGNEPLHWWSFISLFNGIGEGQLSTVVSIREKRRKHKKLTDWEKEFYRDNRKKIDFKVNLTEEEQSQLDFIIGKRR